MTETGLTIKHNKQKNGTTRVEVYQPGEEEQNKRAFQQIILRLESWI